MPLAKPTFAYDVIATGESRFALIADNRLVFFPSGNAIELPLVPTYASFDEASATILLGDYVDVLAVELSQSRDGVTEIKSKIGVYGRITQSKLTIHRTSSVLDKAVEGVAFAVFPYQATDNVFAVSENGSGLVVAEPLESGMASLKYSRQVLEGDPLEPVGLLVDDAIDRIGSKLVINLNGDAWLLAASPASGKFLSTLYAIRGDHLDRFVPRMLQGDGLAVHCKDLWESDGNIGAIFRSFDVMTEKLRVYVMPDLDSNKLYELKSDVELVRPVGEKWIEIKSEGRRWVVRVTDWSSLVISEK